MLKKNQGVVLLLATLYFSLFFLNVALLWLDKYQQSKKTKKISEQIVIDEYCGTDIIGSLPVYQQWGAGLALDPRIGWKYSENIQMNINRKGYLGQCYPYKKRSEEIRIVLLGDSFTGTIQVPYPETYTYKLQQKLSECFPEKKIEIINLGVGGHGLDQEYLTLIQEAFKYQPDLIIHNIFLGNDIRDISRELNKTVDWPVNRPHPNKPYLNIKKDGTLQVVPQDTLYYYTNNVRGFFGAKIWNLELAGQKMVGSFDPLSETITGNFSNIKIVGASLFHEKMTLVLLDGRELVITFSSLKERFLSGFIKNNPNTNWRIWQNVGDVPPEITLKERIKQLISFVVLEKLRSFIRERILKSYKMTTYLAKKGLINNEDIPALYILGFQGEYPLDYRVFLKKYDQEWQDTWLKAFRIIKEMREFSEKKMHAKYVVMTIPPMETIHPTYFQLARSIYPALDRDSVKMDVMKPVKLMEDFLRNENIKFLSLNSTASQFLRKQEKNNEQIFLYDPGHAHFNEDGHSFVADELELFIKREFLIEKR